MKKYLLILCFILCLSTSCFADTYNANCNKVYLKGSDPADVAKHANQVQSFYASPFSQAMQDPFVNSMMNGYYSGMQGSTGASYSAIEMQKQQADYAKESSQFEQQIQEENSKEAPTDSDE